LEAYLGDDRKEQLSMTSTPIKWSFHGTKWSSGYFGTHVNSAEAKITSRFIMSVNSVTSTEREEGKNHCGYK